MTAWNLLWVLTFFAIGGIGADYANGIRVKAHLQAAADAAALAGAMDLPDEVKAVATALAYVQINAPNDYFGLVTSAADVSTGHFDRDTRVFSAGIAPINAIEVHTYRQADRNNAQSTFFLRFVGVTEMNLAATSVVVTQDSCRSGGFFSNNNVLSGSNNTYVDGFCLHGETGVKIGSDNSFEAGVTVSMANLNTFVQGDPNAGINDALEEASKQLPLPPLIPAIVASMQSGSFRYLPDFITNGPVYLTNITDSTPLSANTLYVVSDVVDFGSNRTIQNIAVVSEKEIKTGSNVIMRNVFFASKSRILFGSANDFGSADICNGGTYSVYAMAVDNIEFGSQSLFQGMQMASLAMIKLGSLLRGVMGIHGEANGTFDFGSTDTFGGCPDGLTSILSPMSGGRAAKVKLVR